MIQIPNGYGDRGKKKINHQKKWNEFQVIENNLIRHTFYESYFYKFLIIDNLK